MFQNQLLSHHISFVAYVDFISKSLIYGTSQSGTGVKHTNHTPMVTDSDPGRFQKGLPMICGHLSTHRHSGHTRWTPLD